MENKNIEVAYKGSIFYVNASFYGYEVVMFSYMSDGVNIQLV
jgi:hypothetical protein